MAFQVSPGVNTSEIDLTNVVVSAGTSVGGFAGRFNWGPIEEIKLVTDQDNLVDMFQKPDDNNFEAFYTAANFLAYTSALNVVRAANTTSSSATAPLNSASNTATYVNVQTTTVESFYNTFDPEQGGAIGGGVTGFAALGPFIAKWAGALGNSLKMSICPADRPEATGTSTVTWTASSGVLEGTSSSLFLDELRVGDAIKIADEVGFHIVSTISDLNTASVFATSSSDTADASGKSFTIKKRSAFTTTSTFIKGTAVTTADSTVVTGTGTMFDKQFVVGDTIVIGGESHRVNAITSNTVIATTTKFNGTNAAAAIAREWEYKGAFSTGAPTTSTFADDKDMAQDEIHVAIIDENGDWSGTKGEVLEAHANMSVASGARDDQGEDVFYKNYINKYSSYVWWLDHPTMGAHGTTASAVAGNDTAGNGTIVTDGTATFRAWGATADASGVQTTDTFENASFPLSLSFSGGTDGTGPSDADIIRAYDLMKSAEDVDLSLVMCGNHSSTVIRHVIDNLADSRKDCVAFFSPEKADVVGVTDSSTATDNVIDFRDTVNKNSSYAVMDSGYKYQFDKHADKFRYVPLNGDTAGCCAQTDQVRDPFFSPAGFTRGQIKGVVKLPYNPKKAERDKLYQAQVNPVVSFPGEGTILFGDKTQLTKPSAFDRINVRRLFILLEKAISNAAKFQMFEFNDEFTRSQFVAMVEPFLRDIQGRGGIQDFRVVCDASNNTAQVVDTNSFRGDIFIKPSRAINFIQLNFVAVRSGVEFSEVVGAV